jgi:serine/threonine-protein kinase
MRALELFGEIADLTPAARDRYLAEHHIDDGTRRELEDLFAFDSTWTTAVARKVCQAAAATVAQFEQPDRCGPYLLGDLLGRGGMGAVYSAERVDGEVRRKVAVKLLPLTADAAKLRRRFLAERQILASLNHPNIALLLDAGHTKDGQPYLVMEQIDGVPIDVYVRSLDVRRTLQLFIRVCAAVSYAHQSLIVHRDLKPSNILVDQRGEPKLLDFGIAKLLQSEEDPELRTLFTREGEAALTPAYAAPEQLSGSPVTTATDVYALGVLLYVLLTAQHPAGTGPFSSAELVKAVVETEPRPVSHVMTRKRLPGMFPRDLDTIVAKALKKNPSERYASVAALSNDLHRYLNYEPIEARPDTLAYRTAKLVRRHRTPVALTVLALLVAITGMIATLSQSRTARMQRDFALRQLSRAEAFNDLNSYVLSDAAPSGRSFTVDDLLARAEGIIKRQHGAEESTRIGLLISIGRQYTVQDEYGKARSVLEEAYQLSRGLADASTRGRAACALAQTLSRTGEFSRANTLFQEGLSVLPKEPVYALDRIFCLERGSEIARNGGNSREAIVRAHAAQSLLKQLPIHSEFAELDTLITTAGAYSSAGQFEEAADAFKRAAIQLAELGRADTQRSGTVFNNWGVALILAGRPLDAEKALWRSIEISMTSEGQESVQAMPLVNYARALFDLNRVDDAREYAERGLARAQQTRDAQPTREASLLLAGIYRAKGDLDRASGMLSVAAAQFQRTLPSGHGAFAGLAFQRALNAKAAGDLSAALKFSNEAMAIAEASSNIRGAHRLPQYLIGRADVELQLGHADDAHKDAIRAISILRSAYPSEAPSASFGRAYWMLGRTLQALGKDVEAAAAFRSATGHLRNALGNEHPDTRNAEEQALGRQRTAVTLAIEDRARNAGLASRLR